MFIIIGATLVPEPLFSVLTSAGDFVFQHIPRTALRHRSSCVYLYVSVINNIDDLPALFVIKGKC